jgi:hypothetical protein
MYESTGVLRYSGIESDWRKLHVEIDEGIGMLYRVLTPKSVRLQKPRYPMHISVIRKELIPRSKLHLWGKYADQTIHFQYDPQPYNDETYYWLRVHCPFLMYVRRELGLPSLSDLARPPDMAPCFHTTFANLKGVSV